MQVLTEKNALLYHFFTLISGEKGAFWGWFWLNGVGFGYSGLPPLPYSS
jgi:hypothetical protein